MKNNIEFINKTRKSECWVCGGKRLLKNKRCKFCKGTGKWREPNYILIANGLAFQVDGIK